MFYLLNSKEENKKGDVYKLALKSLTNELKKTDFSFVTSNDNNFGDTSMDSLVSWIINNPDDLTANSLEKKLKKVYREFSVEELYFMYVSSLDDVLTEEFMLESAKQQGVDLSTEFSDYDEAYNNLILKSLIGTLCAYVLVINEQLLDKQLETINVDSDFSKSRLSKSFRKANFSLYKGIRGIPLILSEKEAIFLNDLENKLIKDGYNDNILNHTATMYSYRSLELLVSKYCFGRDINKYIEFKDFIGQEAFNISDLQLLLAPTDTLSYRKVIPNEEGVILKLEDHLTIESIFLSECSRFNYRIIFGIVRYNNGLEHPISFRLNYNSTVTLTCYNASDVLSIILDYYKIPTELLKPLGNLPKPTEYEVISGEYWALREDGYKTQSDKAQLVPNKKLKREFIVKSGTYVRKANGSASTQTIDFANKLRIKLEDGSTLIKEKDRQYFRDVEDIGFE